MIRTVQPQRIDPAERGETDIIYLEAHSPRWNDVTASSQPSFVPTVLFSVTMYRLIGGKLVLYKKNDAIFKMDRWLGLFGSLSTIEFREKINEKTIDQILFVNDKTRKTNAGLPNGWTGNEIQIASYWHETITQVSDFEEVEVVWDDEIKGWKPTT